MDSLFQFGVSQAPNGLEDQVAQTNKDLVVENKILIDTKQFENNI